MTNKTVKEAVITANGKIEDILNELFTEYEIITKSVDLHTQSLYNNVSWNVIVKLEVSI